MFGPPGSGGLPSSAGAKGTEQVLGGDKGHGRTSLSSGSGHIATTPQRAGTAPGPDSFVLGH